MQLPLFLVNENDEFEFGDEYETTVDFCKSPTGYIEAHDANGDGYADITCHDADGSISIMEGHIGQYRHISTRLIYAEG